MPDGRSKGVEVLWSAIEKAYTEEGIFNIKELLVEKVMPIADFCRLYAPCRWIHS
jgi:hypothetical protein